MKRGAPARVLVQAVGVAAATIGGAGCVWLRTNEALCRQTLGDAVAQLSSQANETKVLLEESHRGAVDATFVGEHARQLGELVDSGVDDLARRPVPSFLSEYKESTIRQGRALHGLLANPSAEGTGDAERIADALTGIATLLRLQS
jgi:hypothetical protein